MNEFIETFKQFLSAIVLLIVLLIAIACATLLGIWIGWAIINSGLFIVHNVAWLNILLPPGI